MDVSELAIANYRSIRQIRFPVRRLSVFVGENGAGKTNLYRSLQLVQAAACGQLAREVAAEGGMTAALWAGSRRKSEKPRIAFTVRLKDEPADLSYVAELGIAAPTAAAFPLEPQVKSETLRLCSAREVVLMARKGPGAWYRDAAGRRQSWPLRLPSSACALAEIRDESGMAPLERAREVMLGWRFIHAVRTDGSAPVRQPCLAVTAPVIDSDGGNLAAVLATLAHIVEDTTDLDRAIDDAFPGAKLLIPRPERFASFALRFPDTPRRAFEAAELSDGTLQFLALAGALLSWRLPPFLALNEPETSLHPDLLPAVARMIAVAAERTQIWVVTHSPVLAEALRAATGVLASRVERVDGATTITDPEQFP